MLLVSVCTAAVVLGGARADSPPLPDYLHAYGTVQASGLNIVPDVQPVIAFVHGRACGMGETLLAPPGDGTRASDVGKTAYVVDIEADDLPAATGPACGRANDPVLLYFPASHRVALQQPLFAAGARRTDVDLAAPLQYQLLSPLLAADGIP
jgi:hypothetical protein